MAVKGSIWATLDLEPTNEERDIRRAYARRLKEVHPEDDPVGFQALRQAYDEALDLARRGWAVPPPRRSRSKPDTPTSASEPAQNEVVDEDDWGDADDDQRWREVEAAPPSPPSAELPPEVRAELEAERERVETHHRLCDELGQILAEPAVPKDDPVALLVRIFRSPAMDSLQVHANTEQWLAWAIANGGPAADALIEPAVRFFGWDSDRVGVEMHHAEPVLRRRQAHNAVEQLSRPSNPAYPAWKALRAPQTLLRRMADRLDTQLERQVAELLARISYDLPDLERHLDPEAVAVWRARLSRGRFSPLFFMVLFFAPPVIALIGLATQAFGPFSFLNFIALWVLSLGVLTGLGAAWVRGVLQPMRAWRSGNPWGEPLWRRLGWVPAIAVLLILSSMIPLGDWLWPLFLMAGIAVLGWAKVVSSHVPARRVTSRFQIAEFVGVLPALLFASLTPDGSGALMISVVCAAFTFRAADAAVVESWLSQSEARRKILSLTLIGGAFGVGALTVLAGAMDRFSLCAGLVCAFALTDRAIAFDRFGALLTVRRFWLLLGWAPMLIGAALPIWPDGSTGMIAMLALTLCGGGLFTGIAGLLPETSQPQHRRKRRAGHLA